MALLGVVVLTPVLFCYSSLDAHESIKTTFLQVTALALLAFAAARAGSWRQVAADLRRLLASPVSLAVLLGCVSAVVSTALSISPRVSLQGLHESCAGLGTVLALAVIFFASRGAWADRAALGELSAGLAVGVALCVGYGLIEIVVFDPLPWQGASGFGRWLRPASSFGHPNWMGGYLAMALPLLLWCCLQARRQMRPWALRLGLWLGVMAVVLVVASLSRAAWLAGLLACLVLLPAGWAGLRRQLSGRRLLLTVAGGVAGLACLFGSDGLGPTLVERVRKIGESPPRRACWEAAWRAFCDRPWTGHGLDTFGLVFPRYRGPEHWQLERGYIPFRAHNDFLHALATQGALGGAAYLLLPAALLWAGLRAWKRRPQDRLAVLTLLAVVAAFYAQNLFGFAMSSCAALLAVCAGLLSRLAEPEAVEQSPAPRAALVVWAVAGWAVFAVQFCSDVAATGIVWQLGTTVAVGCVGAVGLYLALANDLIHLPHKAAGVWPGWPDRLRFLVAGGVAVRAACLAVTPFLADCCIWHGDAYLRDAPQAAIDSHQEAVRLADHYDRTWMHLALGRHHQACLCQDVRKKARLLRQADQAAATGCALVPDCAENHANRARILVESARLKLCPAEQLLAAFDRALALDPHNGIFLAEAARAAVTVGRLDAAGDYLKRGLELDPDLGEMRFAQASLCMAQDQLDEAVRLLDQAQETPWCNNYGPRDQALLLHSYALLQLHRLGRSLCLCESVLQRQPHLPSAHWLRGQVLEALGRKSEAIAEYRLVAEGRAGRKGF